VPKHIAARYRQRHRDGLSYISCYNQDGEDGPRRFPALHTRRLSPRAGVQERGSGRGTAVDLDDCMRPTGWPPAMAAESRSSKVNLINLRRRRSDCQNDADARSSARSCDENVEARSGGRSTADAPTIRMKDYRRCARPALTNPSEPDRAGGALMIYSGGAEEVLTGFCRISKARA